MPVMILHESQQRCRLPRKQFVAGIWGLLTRGIMPEPLDDTIFKLPVNKVSPIVQSPYGFHIFKVLEIQPARARNFADMKEEVIAEIRAQKEDLAYTTWLEALKMKAVIKKESTVLREKIKQKTKLAGGNSMELSKRFALIICSIIFLSVPAGAEVVDKIIAVVNDEIITLAEFNAAFDPYLKNINDNYKGKDKEAVISRTKEAFLNRLVDNLLIEQEAKKIGTGILVKDEEVMDVIKDMIAKKKSTMEDFKKNLVREGKSFESIKKDIRSQMMRMRLLGGRLNQK